MNSGLRVAVVGTGSIGLRHLRVLSSLNVSCLAVPARASRRPELEREGWSCANSMEEARVGGATLAVIATDTHRHVSDVEAALHLGFHVLVEKPMAVSAPEARPLPALAQSKGQRLAVGCPLRFDPGLQEFRQRLETLGTLHGVRVECRSFLPEWRPQRDYRQSYSARADEGGVLRDLIHEIDYSQWLFGVPKAITGTLQNLGRLGIQSEEIAEAIWLGPGPAPISMGLDYLSRRRSRFVGAKGEAGEMTYDFITGELRCQPVDGPDETLSFTRTPDGIYLQQMTAFLDLASGAGGGSLATGDDGVAALEICDAWRRSAESGRKEMVPGART